VCLNGEEVCCHDKPRQFVPDQDTVSVKLKGGPNVLLFKVVNEQGQWRWLASLRFADAAGQPVKGIRVTLTPPVAR
jgi:hypothetical protein